MATLGLAIGVGALWVSLRGVTSDAVFSILADIGFAPLGASLIAYLTNIGLRGLRWYILLKGGFDRPFAVSQTFYVGYAVNNVLPARLGEFFRIEYAHRRLRLPRGYCAGALLVERVLDLVCLGIVLALGMALLPTADAAGLSDLAHVGWIFAAMLATAIVLTALVIMTGSRRSHATGTSDPAPEGIMRRAAALLHHEIEHAQASLRAHDPRDMLVLCELSIVIWSLEGVTLYLLGISLGLTIPLSGIALVVFVASLATLVPSAPGYVGSFQLAFVVALSLVGIPPSASVTAATLQQVVNIGLATLIGFAFLATPAPRPKA